MKVDGNDVEAVLDAASEACDRARAGGGPTLIEAETMRMHGHGAHDDMRYVPKEMLEEWARRDPIETYEARLRADGIDIEAIHASVRRGARPRDRVGAGAADARPGDGRPTACSPTRTRVMGDGVAPWSRSRG